MKKIFLLLAITFLSSSFADAAQMGYSITSYKAVFEPVQNTNMVKVTLHIEYHVTSGVKTGGFKFIGNYNTTEIAATDDEGNPLEIILSNTNENKLEWFFDKVEAGNNKIIKLSFVLSNLLQKHDDLYTLRAVWAGVFKTDVKNSEYILVFPGKQKPFITDCTPRDYIIENISGKWQLVARQRHLTEKEFIVSFDTNTSKTGEEIHFEQTVDRISSEKDDEVFMTWIYVFISIFTVIIAKKYFNNNKGSDGSGCSGSSCGGGGCGGCGD